MPLFDLQCQACQHVWEAQVKGGEALPECPACKATTVEKLFTMARHAVHTPYTPAVGETITLPRRKEYGKR